MARPLRIQYEDACYHVTCRGNGGQGIFVADYDRKKFLELAARSLDIYGVELLAFVLMTNHFHFIVKTPRANLQEFMRHFSISYTAYFNRRHNRSGHLYQGRYKAFLVDADSYLLEVSRYLHLNPLHTKQLAGATKKQKREYLRGYRWSSYPDCISQASRHAFLSLDGVLRFFKGNKDAYRKFVEGALDAVERPLEKGKGHGIVGDPDFVEKVLIQARVRPTREQPEVRKAISLAEPEKVLAVVMKRFVTTTEDIMKRNFRGPARGVAMELLYRHAGMNQREIGEMLGVDYSTVSVTRKRLRDMLAEDRQLQNLFVEVEIELGEK